MAPLQAEIILMVVVRCVAVAVVTGKEAEGAAVSISADVVDLVMGALAGQVVGDHLSWIVTASEICWIETVLRIASVSACLTETGNGILCGIETEIVRWIGVIDSTEGTSGRSDGRIVRIVTGHWSLGNAIVLLAGQTIVALSPRPSPPRPTPSQCQVRWYQIDCPSTTPPNKRSEKHQLFLDR